MVSSRPGLLVFSLLLIGAGVALGADGAPASGGTIEAWTATDETSAQFIVSGICLFIGGALANSPITRWIIPFLVALSGGAVYCGFVESFTVVDFIHGFYAGAASTGIYEATKGRREPKLKPAPAQPKEPSLLNNEGSTS